MTAICIAPILRGRMLTHIKMLFSASLPILYCLSEHFIALDEVYLDG
jgi:hypothetical protein